MTPAKQRLTDAMAAKEISNIRYREAVKVCQKAARERDNALAVWDTINREFLRARDAYREGDKS